MTVASVIVKVYCDGGYHEPTELRFADRALKSDITTKLRSMGWSINAYGQTYCPAHKDKSKRTRNT